MMTPSTDSLSPFPELIVHRSPSKNGAIYELFTCFGEHGAHRTKIQFGAAAWITPARCTSSILMEMVARVGLRKRDIGGNISIRSRVTPTTSGGAERDIQQSTWPNPTGSFPCQHHVERATRPRCARR
jgi:hypothetical protein